MLTHELGLSGGVLVAFHLTHFSNFIANCGVNSVLRKNVQIKPALESILSYKKKDLMIGQNCTSVQPETPIVKKYLNNSRHNL